jgi:hypothetical protein
MHTRYMCVFVCELLLKCIWLRRRRRAGLVGSGSFNVSKHAVNASTAAHIATAKQLVVESAILLKNEDHALPLRKTEPAAPAAAAAAAASAPAAARSGVAVFGLAQAKDAVFGGTGSGSVVPSYPISPWDGITAHDSPARTKAGFTSFSDHTADSKSTVPCPQQRLQASSHRAIAVDSCLYSTTCYILDGC